MYHLYKRFDINKIDIKLNFTIKIKSKIQVILSLLLFI